MGGPWRIRTIRDPSPHMLMSCLAFLSCCPGCGFPGVCRTVARRPEPRASVAPRDVAQARILAVLSAAAQRALAECAFSVRGAEPMAAPCSAAAAWDRRRMAGSAAPGHDHENLQRPFRAAASRRSARAARSPGVAPAPRRAAAATARNGRPSLAQGAALGPCRGPPAGPLSFGCRAAWRARSACRSPCAACTFRPRCACQAKESWRAVMRTRDRHADQRSVARKFLRAHRRSGVDGVNIQRPMRSASSKCPPAAKTSRKRLHRLPFERSVDFASRRS